MALIGSKSLQDALYLSIKVNRRILPEASDLPKSCAAVVSSLQLDISMDAFYRVVLKSKLNASWNNEKGSVWAFAMTGGLAAELTTIDSIAITILRWRIFFRTELWGRCFEQRSHRKGDWNYVSCQELRFPPATGLLWSSLSFFLVPESVVKRNF